MLASDIFLHLLSASCLVKFSKMFIKVIFLISLVSTLYVVVSAAGGGRASGDAKGKDKECFTHEDVTFRGANGPESAWHNAGGCSCKEARDSIPSTRRKLAFVSLVITPEQNIPVRRSDFPDLVRLQTRR